MPVGVDVGGTFTDVVSWVDGSLSVAKVPTTPDQADGVKGGLSEVPGDDRDLIHGTTAATNALLQRSGARVALVCDPGFEGVLEIGRQNRPSLYDPFVDRPTPLVPAGLRIGWRGEETVKALAALSPEAVAVTFKGSYSDPSAELEAARQMGAALEVPIHLSSSISPEHREFERMSTTVLNAYLQPRLSAYLDNLEKSLGHPSRSIDVMTSAGGLVPVAHASSLAAAFVLSGPAGGVRAAAALADDLGLDRVVSLDMGGTSTDVCRIDNGRPEVSYQRDVDGYPCRLPSVAISTVGAGGGSIAWVDAGSALRVGPKSAGANPGPACYGRGGVAPTVTDANLVLGRLSADNTLGGSIRLRRDLAKSALEPLARQLGMTTAGLALGVVDVVEANMIRAIRSVSVEQGADVRGAHLIAFGGAGGLHATALARDLGMSGVVIPSNAGVFSALGLLLSPPRTDAVTTLITTNLGMVEEAARRMRSQVSADFVEQHGLEPDRVNLYADVRYIGQSYETTVRVDDGVIASLRPRFEREHLARNGFILKDHDLEVIAMRGEATGTEPVSLSEMPASRVIPSEATTRGVTSREGEATAAIIDRDSLASGVSVHGPAVIEDTDSTIWVAATESARVDDSGTLVVTWD